jgi:hypothetical protein
LNALLAWCPLFAVLALLTLFAWRSLRAWWSLRSLRAGRTDTREEATAVAKEAHMAMLLQTECSSDTPMNL